MGFKYTIRHPYCGWITKTNKDSIATAYQKAGYEVMINIGS